MGDSNDRLREAREKAGFSSALSAAKRFGWTPSTYASHENGQTPVPVKAAERYAKAFRVRAAWILTGDMPRNADGKATGGLSEEGVAWDEVDPVVIRAGGDLLYVEEKQPPTKLIGKECVVRLPDGRILVRFLRSGSTRRVFNLDAPGAPAIVDQRIEWAAPVRRRG